MKLTPHKQLLFIFIGFFLISEIVSMHVLKGGVLNGESLNYLYYYTDNRPFLQKIFDVKKTDWNTYSARELSYFFDYIDANLLKFTIRQGIVHFYSILYYIGMLLLAVTSMLVSQKYLGMRSLTISGLISLVFMTSPTAILSASFFRSAKILTISFLFVIIVLFFEYARNKIKRTYLLSAIGILSLLMSVSDRQGFFVVVALSGLFTLLWIVNRTKKYLLPALVFFAVVLLNSFYNYILGPFIIHSVMGYYPDFGWQTVDYSQLLKQPQIFLNSLFYLFDITSLMFGNLGTILGVVILISLITALLSPLKHSNFKMFAEQKNIAIIVLFSLFMIVVLYAIMGLRHPPVFWESLKRFYYPLVIYILLLLTTNAAVARITKFNLRIEVYVFYVLVTLIVLNLIALPGHYKIVSAGDGETQNYYETSPFVLECIKNRGIPAELFVPIDREITVCKAMRGEIDY